MFELTKKRKIKSYVGLHLPNNKTEAEEMWIEIIINIVSHPNFNMAIGNMDYVLGNIVAKYVSSSKYYKITQSALEHIISIGINPGEPLHISKFIYGKNKNTILEHIIPASTIKHAIVENKLNTDNIRHILNNSGFVVIATRAEDKLLKDAKLSDKMPNNWNGFGDNPEKRYEAVGIKLAQIQIEHMGPICR